MKIFTQEDFTPSEKTLQIIKMVAYSYRVVNNRAYCLN